MYNTIDNRKPIYDSEVIKMFSLVRPDVGDFDKKLEAYLKQFQLVQETYKKILDLKLLPTTSEIFDQKFVDHNLDQMKHLQLTQYHPFDLKLHKPVNPIHQNTETKLYRDNFVIS
jgi:hypothetical protein